MKKVKTIKNPFGEDLPIEKMELLFVGANYVLAKYKGYGFAKTYGSWNGYTVEFEEEKA